MISLIGKFIVVNCVVRDFLTHNLESFEKNTGLRVSLAGQDPRPLNLVIRSVPARVYHSIRGVVSCDDSVVTCELLLAEPN